MNHAMNRTAKSRTALPPTGSQENGLGRRLASSSIESEVFVGCNAVSVGLGLGFVGCEGPPTGEEREGVSSRVGLSVGLCVWFASCEEDPTFGGDNEGSACGGGLFAVVAGLGDLDEKYTSCADDEGFRGEALLVFASSS